MAEIHAWLADADGFYVGELDASGATESFEQYAINAAKNGQTAIDKTVEGAVRPPDAPGKMTSVAVVAYSTAMTDGDKLDALAQRLGLR